MELATATATATASSGSSLSSRSSSSSSSVFMLEDESNMNNTPAKKHSRHNGERFFFVGESDEGEHHFLEWCFLCQKPISSWNEIFMYRGDEAFCSEKCRIEHMEMDEALETVERRQRLMSKSHVSYKVGNYFVRSNYEEEQQNKSIFCIQKRPTIANLTACGLTSLQNSGFATTDATFMKP